MLFLVVALFLAFANAQAATDPTKVCLPDVLQTEIYSLERNLIGVLAFDFPQKEVAVKYDNGLRLVFVLSDYSSAYINDTDGTCVKNPPGDIYAKSNGQQCLPAGAKSLSDVSTFLGLNPGGLEIVGWQFDIPNLGSIKVGITASTPSVPVIRQFISSGSLGSDVEIFANPQTTIDDRSIFTIPANCPPATLVG